MQSEPHFPQLGTHQEPGFQKWTKFTDLATDTNKDNGTVMRVMHMLAIDSGTMSRINARD